MKKLFVLVIGVLILSGYAFDPQSDADFFEPPPGFQRLTTAQMKMPFMVAMAKSSMYSFDVGGGWINSSLAGRPIIIFGEKKIDKRFPQSQYFDSLKQSAQQIQKKVDSGAYCSGKVKGAVSFNFDQLGTLLIETARVDCSKNQIPRTFLKYFYIFYPDFELQIHIEGRTAEIEPMMHALSASLESFLSKKLNRMRQLKRKE